jgi:hypothetical protein
LREKKLRESEEKIKIQSEKIRSLKKWCMGAVAAIIGLPGAGYYF